MKEIDIIIFSGQSNMQGESECLSESEAVSNAYEYKWLTNSMVALRNPVGESIKYDMTEGVPPSMEFRGQKWLDAHIVGSSCFGHTNLVPSFCRAYLKDTDREVLAVHIAKGSTQIDYWLPGADGYKMLLEKGSAAIRRASEEYEIGKIYFVWLQGESDAIAGVKKEEYKNSLCTLWAALKSELSIELFGVIRVGRFTRDTRDDEIISAQDAVCAEVDGFAMLTDIATNLNEDPVCMNPKVAGHYSAHGYEVLGDAAGIALKKIRENY